jgi:hypothetical protein
MLVKMKQKRKPYTLSVGIEISPTTIRNSVEVSQNVKNRSPYDSAAPSLHIYPKVSQPDNNRNTCTCVFIMVQFTIAKIQNPARCPPMGKWTEEMWYTYTGLLFS